MLVSVVIPNLNKAPFLEETLKSLFDQEYAELELIAIDGVSTDGSREIFERHRERFTHYISEPDRGQADAVNKGFSLARGEVIAWLNSDDLYFPWTVRRAIELFKTDPDLSLLYGDCVFIDRESRFLRYFIEAEPYDEYRLRNCVDYIMQPTTFFRRSAWEAVGGLDTTLHYAFDYEFWCKLVRDARKAAYIPETLAANRVYDETKTSAGGSERMREIKEVYARHRTGCWSHGYWNFWCTELINRRANATGWFRRFGYLSLALGAKTLGCKNWFYARRRPLQAQGFVGVRGNCQSRARLCLPVKPGDCALRIKAKAAAAWLTGRSRPEVGFVLDSAEAPSAVFYFSPDQPEGIIEIPLTAMTRRRSVASVDIMFTSADGPKFPADAVVGRLQVLPPRITGKGETWVDAKAFVNDCNNLLPGSERRIISGCP